VGIGRDHIVFHVVHSLTDCVHSRTIFAKKWAVVQEDALPYWVGKDSNG
jgi:hypothetical protein